ncbi:hypothetical protein B4168_0277 [Anoxybacillus flavithermus]|nr:hypothetical protein B4168_0277 [Anoxybacillus flavithermus]OAO88809.1 hypothetical protein GT23_0049 [Parageobacillus thermoglucosidasius]
MSGTLKKEGKQALKERKSSILHILKAFRKFQRWPSLLP